jgi:secreted trypsin-like serine protease
MSLRFLTMFAVMVTMTGPVRGQETAPLPPPASEQEDDGSRIVGGIDAPGGSAPWQVEIFSTATFSATEIASDFKLRDTNPDKKFYWLKEPWEIAHRCGGVLIAPDWVLTAAHCITSTPGDFLAMRRVLVGTQNIGEQGNGTVFRIDRAAIHARYTKTIKTNDIALLHIVPEGTPDPAALANARPIRVLGSKPGDRPLGDLQDVIVTGWGLTKVANDAPGQRAADGSVNRSSPRLKQVGLKILPLARCAAVDAYRGKLDRTTICAGSLEGQKDSCSGDSGGPMTRAQGNEMVLVGLVSWGVGCALPGTPAIYTRVSEFKTWIAKAKTIPRGKITPVDSR